MGYKERVDSIINKFGQDVTFTPVDGRVYSEDTGWTNTTGTPVVYKVIPYNIIGSLIQYMEFGNLPEGTNKIASKGDETPEEKYTFTYEGKNYIVNSIKPLPLQGINLANIITASEDV